MHWIKVLSHELVTSDSVFGIGTFAGLMAADISVQVDLFVFFFFFCFFFFKNTQAKDRPRCGP
jgi:hypothetical protein